MKSSRFLLVVIFAFVLSLMTACTKVTVHDHEYSDWTITTAPSETASGVAERVCECGDVDREFVSALNDTSVWSVEVINPTHLELGATVYTSTFGTISFEIPKLPDHEFGDWAITVEPTDVAVGTAVRTCPCEEVEEVSLPALTDTAVWSVKENLPADHFNAGRTVYTSVYGDVTVVLPVIEHTYGDWTITLEPTADTTGTAERVCDCTGVDSVVLPLLTDTSVWTETENVAPDHFNAGSITYSSIYGDVTVVVPMIEHTYGNWTITVDPTLDTVGSAERVCDCNDVDSVELPVLTDTTVWTVVEEVRADHFNEGHILYTSIYGDVNVVLPVNPDHVYGDWTITVEPTLDTVGSAERVCDCNDVDSIEVPVLTNDSVWAISAENPADYNKAGDRTYTSIYGDVTITLAKLVAPYDNKTYGNVSYDADGEDGYYKHGVVFPDDVWASGVVTLDANGKGFNAGGFPFRGYVEFIMVDGEKGAVKIVVTGFTSSETEDGEIVYEPSDSVTTFNGYVDFESGLIVAPHSTKTLFTHTMLFTPYGVGVNDDEAPATSASSSWEDTIAITYSVVGGESYNIFIHKEKVHFGVSFVDLSGNAISAGACYNAQNLRVLDKNGELIEAFAFNGEKLVISDKHEGTYVGDMGEAIVSGYGVMTIAGHDATYEVVADGVLGVYVNGEYYEATISGNTYTATKPMVEITFEEGEHATVEDVTVNKNIAYVLPTMDSLTYQFKGWYYDANFENPVEAEFVPTHDVTLHALWAEKVVVNLSGVLEGDATVVYLGEGDMIGSALPEYGVELSVMKRFIGWYLDADGEISLPEEASVTTADSGITIYALWAEIPAYYGTYYGTELYNAGYGNGGGKTLTIDEYGNMSGLKSGTIISYDPVTQAVKWTPTGKTDVYTFYYNEELDVIAGIYSNNDISNDFYFLSKNNPTGGKVNAYYGIKAPKSPSDSSRGWYAHLVNAETKLGTREIFLYNNYIYTDFTAVDGMGNPLTAATVSGSNILVVKDAEGNTVIAVASQGEAFNIKTDTIDLDAYFGTYVNGEDTLIFDGTGIATLNGVEGTYALATEGSSYGFDVYLANNTEYYEVTLDGDSFTFNKPMVNITYEEGEYASVEDVTVNKNVAYELPFLTHESNVFNGWFYDAEFTSPVGTTILPTKDVTLHALWKVKVILTIVYNNGDENTSVEYSVGDVVDVEMPIYKKHAFVGWYLTETFDEGSEWESGAEIAENLAIYAKWEDAPAFYNNYTVTRITDTKQDGASYSYCYKSYSTGPYIFEIDAYGNGLGSSSPFNGSFTIEDFNEETGYLRIVYGSDAYFGYLDNETGIIVTEYIKEKGLNQVYFFNPLTSEEVTSTNLSSSYWNNGMSRAIQYTYDGVTYSIFVHNEMVYYHVTFEDVNGNAVLGAGCYKASTLIVKDANGEQIAKFAHDGTTLQAVDGYEGDYTGEKAVTVNGVNKITIDGVEGTYTLVEGVDYTADAYVDGAYYEVTLNKEDYTAVVNQPMVTITYETAGLVTVENSVVNKNVSYEIPTPSCDTHVFRGWFFDAELTDAVPADFIPTEDDIFYAEWAEKITLTVVYGNGLDTVVLDYAQGDTIAPEVPGQTNGLFFEGWYLDSAFTTPFTATTIDESTVIYCNWTDVAPFTVEVYGHAMAYDATTGAWTSTNQKVSSSSSGMTITATQIDVEVTFDWSVSSESNWDALYIYANGTEHLNKSTGSGEKSGTFTIIVRAGSNIQIYYKKDGSGDNGSDTATITGLTVAGVPVTEMPA